MDDKQPQRDLLDWLGIRHAPDWRVARVLGPVVAVLIALLIAGAYFAGFAIVYGVLFGGGAASLGTGALIAALLGAPFLIWGTVLKHQTLRYQKEGHITDRITSAVEQLGAEKTVSYVARNISHPAVPPEQREGWDNSHIERLERINATTGPAHRAINSEFEYGHWSVFTETVPNIEVRIGAILSLERIAQDSTRYDKGRDHVRVMEILCAYLRENSPANDLDETPTPFEINKPRIDVQTVINVIKRRGASQQAIEAEQKYRLDLRMVNFDGCDLSKGCFRGAIFDRSRFEGTNFSSADLTGAFLDGSLLSHTTFVKTILHGTRAQRCTFSGGSIFYSLSTSDLRSIWVEGARIMDTTINKRNASCFFGSRETEVREYLEESKHEGLRIAERILMEKGDVEFHATDLPAVEGKAQFFLHWNPYTIDDGAAGMFRQRFIEKHGLHGWPFEE